jgi:hypothetical protein
MSGGGEHWRNGANSHIIDMVWPGGDKEMNGGGGGMGFHSISTVQYSCAHEAQIKFEDLTPYLTYGFVYLARLTQRGGSGCVGPLLALGDYYLPWGAGRGVSAGPLWIRR